MSAKTFGCLLTSEDLAQLQRVHTYITSSQIKGVEPCTEYYLLVADNNNAILSKLISAEVEVELTPFDLLVRKWLLVPYSDQGNYGLSFKVELESSSVSSYLKFESFNGPDAVKRMSDRGVVFPDGATASDRLRRYLAQKGLQPSSIGSFPCMTRAECLAVVCHLRNLYGVAPMPAPIIVTTKPTASQPAPQEPKKYIPGKWYMWTGDVPAMCLGRKKGLPDYYIYFGKTTRIPDVECVNYPDLPKQHHSVASRLNYSISTAQVTDPATEEISAPEGYETEDAPVTGFESRGSHAEPSAAPANTYVLSTGVTLIPGKWYTVNNTVKIFLGAQAGQNRSFVKFGCYSTTHDVTHSKFPMLPAEVDVSRLEWEPGRDYSELGSYRIKGPFNSGEEAEASIGKPFVPPKPSEPKPASSEEEIGVDSLVPGKWYLWKSGGKSAWNMQQGVAAMYLGRRIDRNTNQVYWGKICSSADVVISEYPDVPEHLRPIAQRLNWAGNTREFYKSWYSIVPCPAPKGYESTPLPEPVTPKPLVQQDPYSVSVNLLSI